MCYERRTSSRATDTAQFRQTISPESPSPSNIWVISALARDRPTVDDLPAIGD
jgi:hypothetical protein